ncbi:hypothetical protein WN51_02620 [Melipona quadrifasciata]|uniref:Uncharacterized protein n=1 Tax=Melipona quadrifasciata TaxID=166423 RepID=A0A0N0BDT2_9HYME|nr:hypothetical protein WN51_02620 [Melipona quadrifasciata]
MMKYYKYFHTILIIIIHTVKHQNYQRKISQSDNIIHLQSSPFPRRQDPKIFLFYVELRLTKCSKNSHIEKRLVVLNTPLGQLEQYKERTVIGIEHDVSESIFVPVYRRNQWGKSELSDNNSVIVPANVLSTATHVTRLIREIVGGGCQRTRVETQTYLVVTHVLPIGCSLIHIINKEKM